MKLIYLTCSLCVNSFGQTLVFDYSNNSPYNCLSDTFEPTAQTYSIHSHQALLAIMETVSDLDPVLRQSIDAGQAQPEANGDVYVKLKAPSIPYSTIKKKAKKERIELMTVQMMEVMTG